MGQLDLTRHIQWSADDNWYYGSIDTVGPEGTIAKLQGKISRPWVYKTAMAVRRRLMETAPAGVDVGAWTNLSDPDRFHRLCQHVANERIQQQIIEKYKRHGIIPTPWFKPWTLETADRAYELVVAAQAGNEAARAQLDRIREYASSDDPRAREALSKINAVAKMVVKGMPKPSTVATTQPTCRPALPKPARPVRRRQLPPARLPSQDEDAELDENIELEEEPGAGRAGEFEGGDTQAGEEQAERAEWDAVSAEDVSPSEEDIEFGVALGWVANQFVSVDGSQWTWTGQSNTNDIEGEVRVLRSNRGKDLTVSQGELLELIKEGELTPLKGTEIAGSDPRVDLMIASLGAVSAQKRAVLQQRRAAPGRTPPAKGGAPAGRGAPAKGGAPAGRGAPAAKGGAPSGKSGSPLGRITPTKRGASPSGLRSMPTGANATAKAPVPARAAISNAARAAAMTPIIASASPAVMPNVTARIPGMLYPGDPGYPLMPGMPGYGTPIAGSAFAGLPQQMPMGGGGGGGGGDFPDEGGGGGGGGDEWGGDSPDDFEESLPHDAEGNVTFPEEGDVADGAQYPEEVAQSSDVDAGSAADDGEGPDVFPDEGAQPPGRG